MAERRSATTRHVAATSMQRLPCVLPLPPSNHPFNHNHAYAYTLTFHLPQANRDKASPLPSPGHIYTPSSTFATLCVMAGGESKTINLWKAGHHLEMAGVKQVSYWFSHMCTLPTPGGTSASSSGAHNRRPIKHRDWRRNIRGNTSEYRSLR